MPSISPKTGVALVIAVILLTAPVTAQQESTDSEDSGDTIVNINLDAVVDAIEDFTNNWDSTLKELITAVLFKPFRTFAQTLLEMVTVVLTNTPTIHPNPAVEEVHQQVLVITYILSTIAFMAAGLLYMTGPILGVSYQQARMILPRVLTALIFGSVSLPLLQFGVELSDALVVAFAPSQLSMTLTQLAGTSVALVLVWIINAALLLALVALFIIRGVYLLFVAAISPLLALMWALPQTKRYADTFIAGWFAALAMAPLDVLVLRFVMAMLNGNGANGLQGVSNWMFGIAGFALLLWAPYQLYGASQAGVGQAYSLAGSLKSRYGKYRKRQRHQELVESNREQQEFFRRANGRMRANNRRRNSDNRFETDGGTENDGDRL